MVLVNGEEITSIISNNENTNSVTLDFTKDITKIEIIDTTITYNPSLYNIVELWKIMKSNLFSLDQTVHDVKPKFIQYNVELVLI